MKTYKDFCLKFIDENGPATCAEIVEALKECYSDRDKFSWQHYVSGTISGVLRKLVLTGVLEYSTTRKGIKGGHVYQRFTTYTRLQLPGLKFTAGSDAIYEISKVTQRKVYATLNQEVAIVHTVKNVLFLLNNTKLWLPVPRSWKNKEVRHPGPTVSAPAAVPAPAVNCSNLAGNLMAFDFFNGSAISFK
jgi:hypothetical protein